MADDSCVAEVCDCCDWFWCLRCWTCYDNSGHVVNTWKYLCCCYCCCDKQVGLCSQPYIIFSLERCECESKCTLCMVVLIWHFHFLALHGCVNLAFSLSLLIERCWASKILESLFSSNISIYSLSCNL